MASHVPIDVVTKAFDGSGFMLMLRFIANRFGNATSYRRLTLLEKITRSFGPLMKQTEGELIKLLVVDELVAFLPFAMEFDSHSLLFRAPPVGTATSYRQCHLGFREGNSCNS